MKTSAEAKARMLFVLFLLAVAAAAGGWWLWRAGRYSTYEIRSGDAVSGLIAGSPVEFHGVEVGKVQAVELETRSACACCWMCGGTLRCPSATVATITAAASPPAASPATC